MTFRHALILTCVGLVCNACATGGAVPRPFPGASGAPQGDHGRATAPPRARHGDAGSVPIADPIRAELVATALGLRGTPYRYGGSDPSGFDCSGFVQYVFARHSTPLPREAWDQYYSSLPVPLDEVQPGDLVFFETVARGPSHVGVAIGGDQFVHAPSERGVVRIERYTAAYWSARFLGARRVVHPST